VPIFGDGIHGRNPNPGHSLHHRSAQARACRRHRLAPYIAPHTLKLGPDGLIYITCENSAVVAVIDPSTTRWSTRSSPARPTAIADHLAGRQRLYTENEEDATVSVIDLPKRKLLAQDRDTAPLAGIAISADGRTVIAVDERADAVPDRSDSETSRTVRWKACRRPRRSRATARQQRARRHQPEQQHGQPDRSVIPQPDRHQGRQCSRWTWRSAATSVRCLPGRRIGACDRRAGAALESSFAAGKGCESLGFF
jgi:hypothetical protein